MTDVSISREKDFTGEVSDTTRAKKEPELTSWDEYEDRFFISWSTGKEQKEAEIPKLKLQPGHIEELEKEENFSESITVATSPMSEFREQVSSATQQILLSPSKVDLQAQRILRIHFASQILSSLDKIQRYCGKPTAAIYAESLLLTMRTMDEVSPFDPFVEVIMALHDALAYQDNWIKFNPDQYKRAYYVIKSLVQRKHISNDAVEKAIMELEKFGFDTTPFELDIDFRIDEDGKE